MPQFLSEEIQDYIKMLYGIGPDDRMFTVTKSYLHRKMDRGAKEAGYRASESTIFVIAQSRF